MRYVKAIIGIGMLLFGAWIFAVLLTEDNAKVPQCVIFGSLAVVWGAINLKNWDKKGVFMRFDEALDNKVFGRANNPPVDRPRPEKPTPPPPETKAEKRERIKQERADLWQKPEVVPPEKPHLLRPPIGTPPQKPIIDVEPEEVSLTTDQIQELLGRR